MQNIKKYFMTLALLLTSVTGAWAGGLEGRTFVDFKIEFRDNPYKVILPASGEWPAGVLVDGTTYNGNQHGVKGGTITVPVDGPVKFTIGVCQYSQNEIVVKKDGEAFTTVNNQATCGESTGSFAKNVTYVYNGKAATLTFEFTGNTFIPYFFAEAVEGSIEVTWDAKTKTGTFVMPAFDVEIAPIYAPVAQWAKVENVDQLPTAAVGIYAESNDSIVTPGTVAKIGETENVQGIVMYAVTSTNQAAAPALTAFSATLPTARDITTAGDVYVWYYIKGVDAPDGTEATDENTFNDSEICTTPLKVTVLNNKFDIQFTAANANTIEAGKAAVKVGTAAAEVKEGKLESVKMNSKVTIAVSEGYKIKSATAKQNEGETTVTVTVNEAKTEASFDMPTFDVAVSYELIRDITQKVDVETRIDGAATERIRIAKDNEGHYKFVTKQEYGWQFAAVDKLDNNKDLTNGELTYTLKMKVGDEYVAKNFDTELCPGTWRLEATANAEKPYEGTAYGKDIELYNGYEVTVPAGEYASYYSAEALTTEDADAELYTIASVTDTEAVLSDKIKVAPKETPLLVYNKSEESKTFLLIPTTETADEVTVAKEFKGSLTEGEIPASSAVTDYYALNGKAFVWVKYAIEIGANKCWLQIGDQPAAARAMTRSIVGGGDTTGIDSIDNEQLTDDSYFDLQGRKVAKPTRGGIYIHNGKKVILK